MTNGKRHRLETRVDLKFGENALDVAPHRVQADVKVEGDVTVVESLNEHSKYLTLAYGKSFDEEVLHRRRHSRQRRRHHDLSIQSRLESIDQSIKRHVLG